MKEFFHDTAYLFGGVVFLAFTILTLKWLYGRIF